MNELAISNKEFSAPERGMSPENHSAWLEKLESAQWQQRLRYQRDGGERANGSESTEQDLDPSSKPAKVPVQPLQEAKAANSGRAISGLTSANAEHAEAVATRAERTDIQLMAEPVACMEEKSITADEMRSQRGMPIQTRRYLVENWRMQHTHAMLTEEGLKVWLRDARYGKNDGHKLLRLLRGHFAGLGLRLARFTLNGAEISETRN